MMWETVVLTIFLIRPKPVKNILRTGFHQWATFWASFHQNWATFVFNFLAKLSIEIGFTSLLIFSANESIAKLWHRIEYDDADGLAQTNADAKTQSNPGRSDPSVVVDPW